MSSPTDEIPRWPVSHVRLSFKELDDFQKLPLCAEQVALYERYQDKNFNDPFVENLGTEQILDTVRRYGKPGKWADLGAGTSTPFWYLVAQDVAHLTCCDLSVEALAVMDRFIRSGRVPACYRDVIKLYDLPADRLASIAKIPRTYWAFDVLDQWPDQASGSVFDTITVFGVFAIASTRERYQYAVRCAAQHLVSGGTLVGADWVRREDKIDASSGRDHRYVDQQLIEKACAAAGLIVCDIKRVALIGDPTYRELYSWVMRSE
jgi:hypothetical protein